MSSYRLRVRCAGPNAVPLIDFLTPESTFENLNQVLSSATEIPEHQLKILSGYPPKPLKGYESSQLQEVGIRNGDVLIVEKRKSSDQRLYSEAPPQFMVQSSCKPSPADSVCQEDSPMDSSKSSLEASVVPLNVNNASSASVANNVPKLNGLCVASISSGNCKYSSDEIKSSDEISASTSRKNILCESLTEAQESTILKAPKRFSSGHVKDACKGILYHEGSPLGLLQKLEVPSDNSCLFASMIYVLHGSISSSRVQELRREVADAITTKPWLVPDEVLDKPRAEYSAWILKDQSWGGEIELAVLSSIYAVEIVTVDARTGRMNRFGEAEAYAIRVFLLYDGVHYDPLHMESPASDGVFYTSFPATAEDVLAQANELAVQAHASGSFTDTDNFTLQCGQCGLKLRGEGEALLHAKTTAHTAFQEVTSR
ncbi:OTU domain [Trinorchestia longiramus]|nr:OTU domain [Trinorchestia longiramus]